MPPPLDLSHPTHKVMVASPRINLRRAASYNTHDRGPLSSTSSRFNFNHLLFSPPPSPSLPALVPRPRKPQTKILISRPSRILRLLFYISIILSTFYLATAMLGGYGTMPALWPYFGDAEFEMVGQDSLPDFPTPIVVSDHRGRSRWTVFVPPESDFPLSIQQYADMSMQCRETAALARKPLEQNTDTSPEAHRYDASDDCFLDISKAEEAGLLHPAGVLSRAHTGGHFVGLDQAAFAGRPVCESSMTFILENSEAGLGNTIMMLWTFFGLAKEQGRAFFVDDTRWAYGRYADVFQAPPLPDCRPPPRHHMVPCPFEARHLVVSGTTAKEIFPALVTRHHRASGHKGSLRNIYDLARVGQASLFKLNDGDQAYVDERVSELRSSAKSENAALPDQPVIGLHIRHGDRRPLEYEYRRSYIPTGLYLANAGRLAEARYNETLGRPSEDGSFMTVLATDDPTVYDEEGFTETFHAQERIHLALKEVKHKIPNHNPRLMHHFEEESFGWEGGFFAPMFWNMGVGSRNNAANAPEGVEVDDVDEETRYMAPPSEHTLQLRSLIGRAYMMDLAVLAGASDHVVCAVSAMGCRLLGVMMGWERGISGGGWKNVDGDYGWTGIEW